MEHNKLFIVFLLLTIYFLTINKKLFVITFLFLISFLLYVNNQIKLSLTFLIVYLLTLLIQKKRLNQIEKFNNKKPRIKVIKIKKDGSKKRREKKTIMDNVISKSVPTSLPTISASISTSSLSSISSPISTSTSKPDSTTSSLAKINSQKKEVFFVLDSLLDNDYFEQNKKNITNIILKYNIDNLFDLSLKLLNKEDNINYNNLLEKITCNKDGKVQYLDNENINYKKIRGFSELYLVYNLEIEKIIELINTHKIYNLCDLKEKINLLKDDNNTDTYSSYGLEYYLNEKSFNDKYYEILKILGLTDELGDKIMIKETLYNYNDSNKQLTKDLNSIMVLFDFYKVFDNILLNYDERDINWELLILKNINLNKPYWNNISYFSKYNIKGRILKAINKFTKTEDDMFSIELAKDKKNEKNKKEEEEYKVLPIEDNCTDDKEFVILKDLSIEYILKNFSLKITDVINDIILLFNKRCALDCSDSDSKFGIFIFYFKEIAHIISKDERLFFVGILVAIIGIIMNFANLSK